MVRARMSIDKRVKVHVGCDARREGVLEHDMVVVEGGIGCECERQEKQGTEKRPQQKMQRSGNVVRGWKNFFRRANGKRG